MAGQEEFLSTLQILISNDGNEWTLNTNGFMPAPNNTMCPNGVNWARINTPSTTYEWQACSGLKVFKADVYSDPILLGEYQGTTGATLVDDNTFDFKLTLMYMQTTGNPGFGEIKVVDCGNQKCYFQDVEVQPAVPAPIPIIGAAAAFGSIRKAKKFSSLLKVVHKA